MPWRLSNSLKYSMPNSLAFSAITRICSMLSGSGLGFERSVVGDVVVDHGQRLLRRANFSPRGAETFEGLRRGHFMDQMAVDIEQAGAVVGFVNQMIVPDLVVQGCRFGHERKLQEFPKRGARISAGKSKSRRSVRLRA